MASTRVEKTLQGLRVAVLCTDGVEQIELIEPSQALMDHGADVEVVSPKTDRVQTFEHHEQGRKIEVDTPLANANADDYDALVLPGGVINPDQLRADAKAVDFVRAFVKAGKPIAAICHGPWTLIEAGAVEGKHLTSWPSLKTDLVNAGAKWEDASVVRDVNLVTSRKPDDLPAFNQAMIELFTRH